MLLIRRLQWLPNVKDTHKRFVTFKSTIFIASEFVKELSYIKWPPTFGNNDRIIKDITNFRVKLVYSLRSTSKFNYNFLFFFLFFKLTHFCSAVYFSLTVAFGLIQQKQMFPGEGRSNSGDTKKFKYFKTKKKK